MKTNNVEDDKSKKKKYINKGQEMTFNTHFMCLNTVMADQ